MVKIVWILKEFFFFNSSFFPTFPVIYPWKKIPLNLNNCEFPLPKDRQYFWLAIFRVSSKQKTLAGQNEGWFVPRFVENDRVVLERKLSFKKLNHVYIFTQIVQYLMNYLFELLHNTILIRYLQCKQCYMYLKNKTNSSVEEMKERRKTASILYNSTLLDKTVYTCIMNGIVLSVISVIILTHKYMYISI